MRIYLQLSPNTEIVPYDYQQTLVGAFHKWLGKNALHDELSLYSLSWLDKGSPRKQGLDFPNGSTFFISAPDPDLLAKLVNGVFKGHQVRWGMEVQEVTIQRTPKLGNKQKFFAQSPILLKRRLEDEKYHKYFFPGDELSDTIMTDILHRKLTQMNLSTDVSLRYDSTYPHPKIKKIKYKGIDIKGALCPVIVEGDPRAVAFAWEVGVGNSTGIGFGALIV